MSRETSAVNGLYRPDYEHDACGVGFLVHLRGERSHAIVRDGIIALNNLNHRGACGCEPNTGDGAGVLIQVPHEFLVVKCARLGIALPAPEQYGVGILFSPRDPLTARTGKELFSQIVEEEGQLFLGWRGVPTDNRGLGATALAVEPGMDMAFIGRGPAVTDSDAFERKLFVIRKRFENAVRSQRLVGADYYYFPSLSCRTLVYKGMLTPDQLQPYFPDLSDETLTSALCMYHSRFSTNTFPTWSLAHPFRAIAHNGEINTLRGNVNWMHAREALLDSSLFEPGDVAKLLPIVGDGQSDSACLDNVLELLIRSGRSVAHAMMMLIPEAWEAHATMSQEKRDFYAYHSCLMEPWDGPASIAVTDGRTIGATLDRNGLRPSRYWVTRDGLVIMGSEVGVLDVPPEDVIAKGRLEPGRMFFVDMEQGRIVDDEELKHSLASAEPYGQWLAEHMTGLDELPSPEVLPEPSPEELLTRQLAAGYTVEDEKYILGPMAERGLWAIGSMGNDTPLAVLSDRPQLLYSYFKQLFAQVTNPPLDCIREEIVTSVLTGLGPEGNLLEPGPLAARQIRLDSPILTNQELSRLKQINLRGHMAYVLDATFNRAGGPAALEAAMKQLCDLADRAIDQGCTVLVISDRGVDERHVAIPSLLATAGLHHHLVANQRRMKAGLVVETGDAREVHHFCLLLAYGAAGINPHVAFDTIGQLARDGRLGELAADEAQHNYIKAALKGIVKVMARMGISTVQSYLGAQIFEAIGLQRDLVDKYFRGTASQIEGVGLDQITADVLAHHESAYPQRPAGPRHLAWGGLYQWRREGEHHMFNPETIYRLQHATRTDDMAMFRTYSQRINDQSERLGTLRGLMAIRTDRGTPVPLDEVEPVDSIVRRFCTGAMSYGSISAEAHETLAIAMNRLGGWSNTGEGGEDPERFQRLPNGDSKRSRIKQVASGRFGVTSLYLVNADELQIKMAQGAKPGEGGELPGYKVYPWIAKTRGTTPGVGLISPPPHHDIYSIEDLAQLIFDLKNSNPRARVSVKLVSEVGVGTVAAGVAKAHADVVLVSGHDGGTGASPINSIKHAGTPWELGLAETQQTLILNGLRDRIIVQTDGQLKTGRDVAIAALLGAEEFGFATAPLVTLGCVMMRVCHLDTCPVGVATQNPELRKRFSGRPEYVVNFMRFIAEELREIMAQLGFRKLEDMVGRSDLLDVGRAIDHYKAKGLDLSRIFHRPAQAEVGPTRCTTTQDHGLEEALDLELIRRCLPALERGEKVSLELPIRNVNRTVGAMLGSQLTMRWGSEGLPEDTIRLHFEGSAGQSFGAFVPRGMKLSLEGDANDYCGKGLSGGTLVIYPPQSSPFVPRDQIVIGNVALYGATSGKAFVRGRAGERFAVRNSGAQAVVEGAGDHCCEYMTGGAVVVIGHTGRNFAAGMSGGMAFVLDSQGDFAQRCNLEMVELEPLEAPRDVELVKRLLGEHAAATQSTLAEELLADWDRTAGQFVKVMPSDYKKVLEAAEEAEGALVAGVG